MEITTEIDSLVKYAMKTNMLARQDKRPTLSRHSMNSIVEHLTQRNIPATSLEKPRKPSIWLLSLAYVRKHRLRKKGKVRTL
jgi:hypothetical protein